VKRTLLWLLGLLVLASVISGFVGEKMGSGIVHPFRKPLDAASLERADSIFAHHGATREEFDVRAADGVLLRGWKVRANSPNGDWIMLFHGVADNRVGTISYADFLLHDGYSIVMMDARAHGESGGAFATYGWKERWDTKSVVDALYVSEHPHQMFALGESMGAAVALQSAAIEPRISGVVAEAPFRNLREVTYDYTGLHFNPLLGKTLFRPASIFALRVAENEASFRADDVSPERAVAERPFPVLLICDGRDHTIPCRHAEAIFHAAIGPKQLWIVPEAQHTAAFGVAPAEFERRVLAFLAAIR
jgi:uncharacterized protein